MARHDDRKRILAKRLADMDLDGIDQAICFGGGPLGSFDNDLYIASFEAYSRWVMDWASHAPHRLFPVGHTPMRDIDGLPELVRRLRNSGLRPRLTGDGLPVTDMTLAERTAAE